MPQQAAAALDTLKGQPVAEGVVKAVRLMVAGDYRGLKALSEQELKAGGDPFWLSALSIADVLVQDYEGARQQMLISSPELFEPNPTVSEKLAPQAVQAALICQRLGDQGQARRILQSLLAVTGPKPGRPQSPGVHLVRAKAYTVLGDKEQALKELRVAVEGGYRSVMDLEYFLRMDRDPLLQALWPDPRFRALIAQIEADNARMRQALLGQGPPLRQASAPRRYRIPSGAS